MGKHPPGREMVRGVLGWDNALHAVGDTLAAAPAEEIAHPAVPPALAAVHPPYLSSPSSLLTSPPLHHQRT